jgi:hypothetical protein
LAAAHATAGDLCDLYRTPLSIERLWLPHIGALRFATSHTSAHCVTANVRRIAATSHPTHDNPSAMALYYQPDYYQPANYQPVGRSTAPKDSLAGAASVPATIKSSGTTSPWAPPSGSINGAYRRQLDSPLPPATPSFWLEGGSDSASCSRGWPLRLTKWRASSRLRSRPPGTRWQDVLGVPSAARLGPHHIQSRTMTIHHRTPSRQLTTPYQTSRLIHLRVCAGAAALRVVTGHRG